MRYPDGDGLTASGRAGPGKMAGEPLVRLDLRRPSPNQEAHLSCHIRRAPRTAQYLAKLLHAECRGRGTRKTTRALTCFSQAVLGLRWFRQSTDITALARDHEISRATGYRYPDEVIAVLAAQAPDLHDALQRAKDDGLTHLILDGKVFSADRCGEQTTSVKGQQIDAWYSGRSTSRAVTSKRSRRLPGSRCGSAMSSPARSTT